MVHSIFSMIIYEDFWNDLQLKRIIGTSQPLLEYLYVMMSILEDEITMSDEDNRYCMEESMQHAIYHCFDCGYDDKEVDLLFMHLVRACISKYKMRYVALVMYRTEKMQPQIMKEWLSKIITEAKLEDFIISQNMKDLLEIYHNNESIYSDGVVNSDKNKYS